MGGTPTNILLACEYEVVGLGIAKYLEDQSNAFRIYPASTLEALYSTLTAHPINIAFIELALLKSTGLNAITDILKSVPPLKIIVLSRNEKEPFISQCMELGTLGYVSLKCQPEELLEAISTVQGNQKYLSQDVAYNYALSSLDKNDQLISVLTTREYQVFTQIAQGISVTDIAAAMHLSPKTIHVYRANIMSKLNMTNGSELTLLALKHGVISVDVIG